MRIVGIVGSLRAGSSTGVLVSRILEDCQRRGATVKLFAGDSVDLPQYDPSRPLPRTAADLIEAVRSADALVLGSPAYHGSISGTLKVALDYLEELRGDRRTYLAGMPVASIVTGAGWQGVAATLGHLRDVVHALRGWNVPLGITVNVAEVKLSESAPLPECIAGKAEGVVDDLIMFLKATKPLAVSA